MTVAIASNWDCSLPEWLRPTGILDLVDDVVTSAEVGAAKPSPRVFERALGIAGVEPADALHVGDKVDNDIEGAAAAGIRGVLLQREGDPPAGVESIRSLRGACPPYSDVRAARCLRPATPASARRPEPPEGAAPRWPAWYAGVGFLVALIATLIVVGILAAATGATADDEDPTFTIVATFLQGLIFIGTAVTFASFTRKPKPEQFGLRPTRLWPAAGWAALGMITFYALVALYSVIVQPDAEQSVAQDLGRTRAPSA